MTFYDSNYYLNNNNLNKEHKEKELAQKKYTDTHIKNVQKAWSMIKSSQLIMEYIKKLIINHAIPCSYIYTDGFVHMMDIQISLHDASKYSPEEWEPYRTNFYPLNDKEKEEYKNDFEKAWLHHYTVNKHHWDYWYKIYKNVDMMDLLSVIELCCDWIAMNFVFKGTALEYYHSGVEDCKNKDEQIYLGDKQSKIIKQIFTLFYQEYPKSSE